ncbi:hypothetical protein [Sediminibacterium ginsengisoli]|uniref:HTH cro/C1-type domain-containing protein n=1 Tax=Sediminibacterium ginsengisoli TaxID=413434 RepID=A0A1T4QFJ7_9BACT|nr:hypothetical protein [Sediminibacterium ginsengisoli]SKA02367.1 hypothetical protein SAMN04488132_10893 [Sediminibacterium ginsengisoli]
MKVIDRLYQYINAKQTTPYMVAKKCGISGSYLGKQLKGKGSVGSDILLKIKERYPDLSILWVMTGKGSMIIEPQLSEQQAIAYELREEQAAYFTSKDEMIELLKGHISELKKALSNKDKLIALLEKQSAYPDEE